MDGVFHHGTPGPSGMLKSFNFLDFTKYARRVIAQDFVSVFVRLFLQGQGQIQNITKYSKFLHSSKTEIRGMYIVGSE